MSSLLSSRPEARSATDATGKKMGNNPNNPLCLSLAVSLCLSLSHCLSFSLCLYFSLSLSLLLCPPLKQALEGHLVCAAVADCRPTSVRYTGMYVQRGSSKIEEFLCHPFWKEFSLWLSRHVNLSLSRPLALSHDLSLLHTLALPSPHFFSLHPSPPSLCM